MGNGCNKRTFLWHFAGRGVVRQLGRERPVGKLGRYLLCRLRLCGTFLGQLARLRPSPNSHTHSYADTFSHANTGAHADPEAHADSKTESDSHTESDSRHNPDSVADPDSNADAGTHTDPKAESNPKAEPDPVGHSDSHANAGTYADPETESNPKAEPDAVTHAHLGTWVQLPLAPKQATIPASPESRSTRHSDPAGFWSAHGPWLASVAGPPFYQEP